MRYGLSILILAALMFSGQPKAHAQLVSQYCAAQTYFPLRASAIVTDLSKNEKRLVCQYPRIPRWMMPFGNADVFCSQANPRPLLRSRRTAKATRCVYWFGWPE